MRQIIFVMEKFKFGKYKGEFYDRVMKKDPKYLEWLSKQSWLDDKTKELLNILILKDGRKIIYDQPLPKWNNKLFDKKMQTLCSIKFEYWLNLNYTYRLSYIFSIFKTNNFTLTIFGTFKPTSIKILFFIFLTFSRFENKFFKFSSS